MKIYRTSEGIVIDFLGQFFLHQENWDTFINNDSVYLDTKKLIKGLKANIDHKKLIKNQLLAPIGSQELWAAGVTYYKSRSARMEESKEAGGGSFYDKVYHAERPEIFFKCNGYRVKGPGESVNIRQDSSWNVPEPELTLVITTNRKIIGYTIGNDMSSRSIEGENPLYLPQAKSYNGSAALGPCILLSDVSIEKDAVIAMNVSRENKTIFDGSTTLSQLKRTPSDLVSYLYKSLDFKYGCYMMTGTGIIPPDDFTLISGDLIEISIASIGELRNVVE